MAVNGAVTVTIQANTPVANGRGQETESWANVAAWTGLTAERRFASPRDWNYQAVGGGQRLASREFLIFEPPLDGLTELHRAVVDGVTHKILKVRTYEEFDNQQVDIELIGAG